MPAPADPAAALDLDLELTPDQELLRQTSRRFIEDRLPLARVRTVAEGAAEPDPGYVKAAAELGWFAMFVPEEFGGGTVSGNPVVDAALVAHQRGAALQPDPFVGP